MSPRLSSRALAIALSVFAFLAAMEARYSAAVFPSPLRLEIRASGLQTGESVPLLTCGKTSAGDMLSLHYEGNGMARIRYDSWGFGGPVSPPFRFDPSTAHRLAVQMPGLRMVPGSPVTDPVLRVECDGAEVLQGAVHAYLRGPNAIYFGENPIGASTAGRDFPGTIRLTDSGRIARGRPRDFVPWAVRLLAWFGHAPWAVITVAACAIAAAWILEWTLALGSPIATGLAVWTRVAARHRAAIATATLCLVGFGWLVSAGDPNLLHPDAFSTYYDYQASSVMAGRLDVPPEVMSGEGFYYHGKCYGYFGIFPAVLRMPFVAVDVGFGALAKLFLLGYYAAALGAVYAILRLLKREWLGSADPPSAAAAILAIGTTGFGSTLFFLGSRAYVYHEAILSGACFSLWSVYWSLKYWKGGRRAGLIAASLAAAAVNCRPTTGLFALAVLSLCSIALLRRRRTLGPLAVLGLCAAGLASFNLISFLKFGTIEGMPLRYSIQFLQNSARLQRIEARELHLENFGVNLHAYVLSFNGSISKRFPFVRTAGEPLDSFPRAKYDMNEPILALPYGMTALTLMAAIGVGCGLRDRRCRAVSAALLLAAAPMALIMMLAVVSSERYTADFVPPLAAFACLGLALTETGPWRRIRGWMLMPLAMLSAAVTFLVAITYQAAGTFASPAAGTARYETLARWFDS